MSLTFSKLFMVLSICSLYCFAISEIFGKVILLTTFGSLLSIPYFFYKIYKQNFFFNKYFIAAFSILTTGAVINSIVVPQNGIGGVIVIFGTLSLAVFILDNPSKILIHAFFLLISTIVFLSYKLFFLKLSPALFFEGYSRNYPGFLLVIFNVFYLFILFIVKRKTSVLLVSISLLLSFFLVGRSSIVSLGLLFIIVLLYSFYKGHYLFRIIFSFSLISILVLLSPIIQEVYFLSSFNENGYETTRIGIWQGYLNHISPLNMLIGLDTMEIPIVAKHGGNLHNSFFNLQGRTGLGFITFIIIFIISLGSNIKNRNFYELMLLIILSFRLFFDSNCFIGNMDFVYYSLLIYPLYQFHSFQNSTFFLKKNN